MVLFADYSWSQHGRNTELTSDRRNLDYHAGEKGSKGSGSGIILLAVHTSYIRSYWHPGVTRSLPCVVLLRAHGQVSDPQPGRHIRYCAARPAFLGIGHLETRERWKSKHSDVRSTGRWRWR
jgi:hypothetical protein